MTHCEKCKEYYSNPTTPCDCLISKVGHCLGGNCSCHQNKEIASEIVASEQFITKAKEAGFTREQALFMWGELMNWKYKVKVVKGDAEVEIEALPPKENHTHSEIPVSYKGKEYCPACPELKEPHDWEVNVIQEIRYLLAEHKASGDEARIVNVIEEIEKVLTQNTERVKKETLKWAINNYDSFTEEDWRLYRGDKSFGELFLEKYNKSLINKVTE